MENALLNFDVERDLEEMLHLITDYMRTTYVSEIQYEMQTCTPIQEMPKEAQLLWSLIPFVPEENRKPLLELAELFKYEQIIKQIMPKILPDEPTGAGEELTIKNIVIRVLLYKIIKELNAN
ncbi:MAG: hypothetical protein ATN36_08650 [Epulopiscium sp. Nele67-Bin005]|nr:MAG: hypothetical protein ATN36_08650 [Epulopiscium sp. Nele67-Bin005]